jgi:hypothetical protein
MSPTTDSPAADASRPAADDRATSSAGIARARARWLIPDDDPERRRPLLERIRGSTPAAPSGRASSSALHPEHDARRAHRSRHPPRPPGAAGPTPDQRSRFPRRGPTMDIDRRRSSGRHSRESLGAPARPAGQTTRAEPGPPGQRTDEGLAGDLIRLPVGRPAHRPRPLTGCRPPGPWAAFAGRGAPDDRARGPGTGNARSTGSAC